MAENQPTETYTELRDAYNIALEDFDQLVERVDQAAADPDLEPERLEGIKAEFNAKFVEVEELKRRLESKEARDRARAQFEPIPVGKDRISVREPDLYTAGGRYSFFSDLYMRDIKNDAVATERIERHQRLELEKRAITSSTFGGIIPAQYLVDMYAKASRNGRVFADQVNHQTLPEIGMSVIVPRLTQGLAAGFQATENSAVSTQDITETDLTVNVRTIGGYSPVSRQGLERAQYSDQILFEDLIARYWAQLDSSALSGAGSSGTFLGLIATSGIITSAASTLTAAGVYPKIADVVQQISSNMGGLGYLPDKIFMHPRRWGFFAASLDSQNRPLIVPVAQAVNTMGTPDAASPGGVAGGFGGPVGTLLGLPVFLDPNIPTNLGTNTNEDRIIVCCSPVVHLWERPNDPVTLSFEQQAGTSLQVQLVCYGYAAFTAGRYPTASGIVTGLTPPSF